MPQVWSTVFGLSIRCHAMPQTRTCTLTSSRPGRWALIGSNTCYGSSCLCRASPCYDGSAGVPRAVLHGNSGHHSLRTPPISAYQGKSPCIWRYQAQRSDKARNTFLVGQKSLLINGSSGSALLRLMNVGVTGASTPGPSGSAALCLITQEWTRRKSLPTKKHVGRDFRRSPRRSAHCGSG